MFAGNPKLSLRRAVPDDAWAVQNLIHAAYTRHAPALGRKPRAMLADYALAVRAHQVWVLVEAPPEQQEEQQDADSLIAILELIAEAAHLAVQALAVRPDRQRRGLGTALMQLAERETRRQGVPLLKLNSPEVMTESLSLCEALGFRETHRQPAWDSQIVFMEKLLA